MDQYPAYWMWSRRKLSGRSHVQSSCDASWEEQAFAEDSSSALGGSIWPPRSYSCSFCRREFRSAQALGGHMNVHRRDRARLKQSSNPHVEDQSHNLLHNPNCGTSMGVEYPPRICTLIPNDELSTLKFTTRVTAPFIQDNCSEQMTLVSPAHSFTIGQETNHSSLFSFNFRVSDSKLQDAEDSRVLREVGCQVQRDFVLKPGTDACLVDLIRNKDMDGDEDEDEDEDEEGIVMSKRRRIDLSLCPFLGNPKPSENMVENASLSCFLKPNTDVSLHHLRSEVGGVCPSSIEHLDLELRLGDRPKVK